MGAGSTSRFKKGLGRIIAIQEGEKVGKLEKFEAVTGESGQAHMLFPSCFATTEHGVTQTPFLPRVAFLMFVISHLRCQSEMLRNRKKNNITASQELIGVGKHRKQPGYSAIFFERAIY